MLIEHSLLSSLALYRLSAKWPKDSPPSEYSPLFRNSLQGISLPEVEQPDEP